MMCVSQSQLWWSQQWRGLDCYLIGAKPFIGSTAAFVQTGWVQKIAICEEDGKKCMALSGGRA